MNHDNFTEVTSEQVPDSLIKRYSGHPDAFKTGFTVGYNYCLERTNAAELLQILKQVQSNLNNHGYVRDVTVRLIKHAIKKATDESR